MLKITVPAAELWDEIHQEFIVTKEQTLELEHSLVSLSKWESKWHKPFIPTVDKTNEEIIDYVRCMTLTRNVDQNVYKVLTSKNISDINNYINDSMTATVFSDHGQSDHNNDKITSDLIYYHMIAFNIPFECQKWHLNRLITLIRICDIKSRPPRKLSTAEAMRRNAAIKAANRKRFNSKG